jgi:nicotinamide riboside transporter PnuC
MVLSSVACMASVRHREEVSQMQEEKNNRGKSFLKAIAWLVGFIVIITLGLLILNALTDIGDELKKQTGIMSQQTNILQNIESGIQDLLKQIQLLINNWITR